MVYYNRSNNSKFTKVLDLTTNDDEYYPANWTNLIVISILSQTSESVNKSTILYIKIIFLNSLIDYLDNEQS